ncbi:MAG: hypothetical protein NTW66_00945 [Candidatus Magasanikbacteria bacterium]|nr:hypothetical protein [Candidatus Magasanikbacteria bacterium]
MKKAIMCIMWLSLLFSFLAPGGFALAQGQGIESGIEQSNPLCWTKDACTMKRQSMLGSSGGSAADGWVQEEPCTGEYGKCLPIGITKTQISFGGTNTFFNAGDFIKNIYNYSLVAIQILAVIVIIIAGAQWITSGGNAEAIGKAKKRIGGAVIGMIIALMSYTILNTINPATVNLRLPQVWLLATDAERYEVQEGEWCDPVAGSETKTMCEKDNTKYCELIASDKEGPCFAIAKYTAEGATILMGGGGSSVAAGVAGKVAKVMGVAAREVLKTGVKVTLKYGLKIPVETFAKYAAEGAAKKAVAKTVGKVIYANLTRTGAKAIIGCSAVAGYATGDYLLCGKAFIGGAEYAIDEFGDAFADHNGVCLKKAELYNGDMCEVGKTTCAAGGKCVKVPGVSEMAQCWTNSEIGFCSDGLSGSICDFENGNSDCKSGLHCIEQNVPKCSDGSAGAPCKYDTDCPGLKCNVRQYTDIFDNVAVGACAGSAGIGNYCATNADCASGAYCYTLAWSGDACMIRPYASTDDNDYRNNTVSMIKDAGGALVHTGGICLKNANELRPTLSAKGLKVLAHYSGGGSYPAGWYYCDE